MRASSRIIGPLLLITMVCALPWQLGVGADVTLYSKPDVLDAAYGSYPVSFQIFLRMRPGRPLDVAFTK